MSGKRARAIRRQVYGHHEHSFRPEARGVKFIHSAWFSSSVTHDERRTAYQHAKRDWKRKGRPGPSPLRREPRRGRIPFWDTKGLMEKAWRKKQ